MENEMCSGVFAPVCSPTVCNVPRIPYLQDLVTGNGYIRSFMTNDFGNYVRFNIHIYRQLFNVFGKLEVEDCYGTRTIFTTQLEAYHAPNEDKMIAIFHFNDITTGNTKELAVYASIATADSPAKFFIYSAPLVDDQVYLGGYVENGTITIEKSLVEHEH